MTRKETVRAGLYFIPCPPCDRAGRAAGHHADRRRGPGRLAGTTAAALFPGLALDFGQLGRAWQAVRSSIKQGDQHDYKLQFSI